MKMTSLPTPNLNEFAAKGETIYQQVRDKLDKKHRGEFMAIEVDSGNYFLGKTEIDALVKARSKYPKKIFHFVRVGFPAAVTYSSRFSPAFHGIPF